MIKSKKGMMDDLFDFMFTVIVGFFLFLFIGMVLNGGVEASKKQSLDNVVEFKKVDSAVNNIRNQMYAGSNIDENDIDNLVSGSNVLGGKTITTCFDYREKVNCEQNAAQIVVPIPNICVWYENKCIMMDALAASVLTEVSAVS